MERPIFGQSVRFSVGVPGVEEPGDVPIDVPIDVPMRRCAAAVEPRARGGGILASAAAVQREARARVG